MKREEELDRIGVRPASGRVGRCRKLEVEPGLNRFNLEQNSVRLERSARMVQKMRPFTSSLCPFFHFSVACKHSTPSTLFCFFKNVPYHMFH